MIVECAGCRTRFRLADDKVRSTGSRVRCSRCGTTFVVRPDAPEAGAHSFGDMPTRSAPAPRELLSATRGDEPTRTKVMAPDLLAELRGEAAGQPPVPARAAAATAAVPAAPSWEPPPPPPAAAPPRWEPPPAPPAAVPPRWEPPPPPPPPVAAPSRREPPSPPPEAAPPRWEPPSPPPPSAPAAPGDPLSELRFSDVHFGNTRAPLADELPDTSEVHFGNTSAPLADAGSFDDDPLAMLGTPPAPVAFDRFSPGPEPQPLPPSPHLALDDDPFDLVARPPPPAAAPEPTWDEPLPQVAKFEASSTLELATKGWSASREAPPQARTPPPAAPPSGAAPAAAATPATSQPVAGAVPIGRARPRAQPPPPRGASALRFASGLAVLLTALVAFVVVRGGGVLPRSAAAVLAAFGLGPQNAASDAAELRAEDIRTGRYPSVGGEVFFVRGSVVNHASQERGPAVRVVAELLDGDRVIARGTSFAGVEPTPEQVHGLADAGAWGALAEQIGAKQAGAVRAGDRAPFFVVLPAPRRTDELRLRVTAAPAERPQPAPGAPTAAVD